MKARDVHMGILSFLNYPYIPKEMLNEIKGPLLLHISDTPIDIYSYIFRIINVLKPKFIIHTGDMADNIKLEFYKNRIGWYQKGVSRLIEGLEKDESAQIYYVMGNHDDYDTVSKLTTKGIILEDRLLTIENCKFDVGHYHNENSYNVDFSLYGHSPDPGHYSKEGLEVLNGLLNINIIDLSNKRVFHLKYPMGTNTSRGMGLRGIGL